MNGSQKLRTSSLDCSFLQSPSFICMTSKLSSSSGTSTAAALIQQVAMPGKHAASLAQCLDALGKDFFTAGKTGQSVSISVVHTWLVLHVKVKRSNSRAMTCGVKFSKRNYVGERITVWLHCKIMHHISSP